MSTDRNEGILERLRLVDQQVAPIVKDSQQLRR